MVRRPGIEGLDVSKVERGCKEEERQDEEMKSEGEERKGRLFIIYLNRRMDEMSSGQAVDIVSSSSF